MDVMAVSTPLTDREARRTHYQRLVEGRHYCEDLQRLFNEGARDLQVTLVETVAVDTLEEVYAAKRRAENRLDNANFRVLRIEKKDTPTIPAIPIALEMSNWDQIDRLMNLGVSIDAAQTLTKVEAAQMTLLLERSRARR